MFNTVFALEGSALSQFTTGALELLNGGWEFVVGNPLLCSVLGLSVVGFGISKVKRLVRH